MNRNKKKALRNHIGRFLDISSTRMTDDEASFLECFINDYAKKYKGESIHSNAAIQIGGQRENIQEPKPPLTRLQMNQEFEKTIHIKTTTDRAIPGPT